MTAMESTRRAGMGLVLALGLLGCKDQPSRLDPTAAVPQAAPVAAAGEAPALPPGNAVQNEMRLLTSILEHTVRGIGARDVREIEHELHGLHAAKATTEAALHDGSYTLPKNPEQLAGFVAMDEAFHADLGALVTASRANDVAGAATALGSLVRACEGCHAVYRADPR